MKKRLLAAVLTLIFSLACFPASALELDEAKQLLQDHYVDDIPSDVLDQSSLEDIFSALDDPYTVYMDPEQYQSFLNSVNGESVVGIGASIRTAFDDGYQIMSILPDSPALEAGLEAGDRIIAVDGVTLTASSNIRSLISGDEGSQVTLTVVRISDGSQVDYTLKRRTVVVPIVTYEQVGDVGYINCISFGDSTVATVEEALLGMEDSVSVWIMDLRSNPGGTSDAAAGTAGLFVGSAVMVYFRNAEGRYSYVYTLSSCPDLTDKPLIIMTSSYSASGAELFASDARDHGFGIAVGQRTFGKGIAQSILDSSNTSGLFDGDALKITSYRFYSPDGATNHVIGVLPTLVVSVENTAAVAALLASPQPSRADGMLKLELAGLTFYLDPTQAVSSSRAAFIELLEALPPSATLYQGSGLNTWSATTPAKVAKKLGLSITLRTFSDIASSPFRQEIETLAAYQLLSGYDDGAFHPEAAITRAEFCAMVATALNLPANEKALTFTDTSADAWYADAVSAMAAKGFISGYGDGTFRPNDTITYEEMVTILASVAAWSSMDGDALVQEGVPASESGQYLQYSSWAQVPARTLQHLNALVGDLAPSDNGTRQVAAGMLCSLMENIHLLWD